MVFAASILPKVAHFVSLISNWENNTSVAIKEFEWASRKERNHLCAHLFVFHCVFGCLYVSLWFLDGCQYVYLRFPLCFYMDAFVWCTALCSMYDYLKGMGSFLSFTLDWQSKTACVYAFHALVHKAWNKTCFTTRWPKRSVLMVTANPFYSSRCKTDTKKLSYNYFEARKKSGDHQSQQNSFSDKYEFCVRYMAIYPIIVDHL